MVPPESASSSSTIIGAKNDHAKVECGLHGKVRRIDCLRQDQQGLYVCTPGNECKVSGAAGGTGGGNSLCAIHDKLRNKKYLATDTQGRLCCLPGSECRGAGIGTGTSQTTMMCCMHGKMRSLDSLIHDGTGNLMCAPGRECKGGPAGSMVGSGTGPESQQLQSQQQMQQPQQQLLAQANQYHSWSACTGSLDADFSTQISTSVVGAGQGGPEPGHVAIEQVPFGAQKVAGFSNAPAGQAKVLKTSRSRSSSHRRRSRSRSRSRSKDREQKGSF